MAECPGGLRPRLRRFEFQRATSTGKRFSARYFLVFVRDRGDGGSTRLGITVTRKVGNAVRRTRIKRLVREWFRGGSHGLGQCDVVVVAKRRIPAALGLAEAAADLDSALTSRNAR